VHLEAKLTSHRESNEPGADETREQKNRYTAAMKARVRLRRGWKLVLLVGVVVLLYFGYEAGKAAICLRLGQQIRSIDETCDKMAQSFPKAFRIFRSIRADGGISSNLAAACASVWHIEPLPLTELTKVSELRALGRPLVAWRLPGRLMADRPGRTRVPLVTSAILRKAIRPGRTRRSRNNPLCQV